nr:hypothetical protein [Tanacetum cinerariifolium]
NRLTKPNSKLKELDLDANDQTFIKVVSNEDSEDEAPRLWSALVGWEDLVKLYGLVVKYYETHHVAGTGLILWGDLQVLFDSQEGVEMSRDVLTVGYTMRIPLLYRGEYSQRVERFMNYIEEQTDGEAMINSIKNDVKPASTPIDKEKALLKDLDGDDVDVHLYTSMIGSLMYLTSSRPDIMFVPPRPTSLDLGFVVPTFLPIDDLIASLNKALMFLSTAITSRYPNINNQLRTSSNLRTQENVEDGRVMEGFDSYCEVLQLNTTSIFITDHVDAFDLDCDESSIASAIFMPRISPTGLVNRDDVEFDYSEQPVFVSNTYVALANDNNVLYDIPYTDSNEKEVIQDMNFLTQNDAVILLIIENIQHEVTRCNTINQESRQVNDSLTAELEQYKEKVPRGLHDCLGVLGASQDSICENQSSFLRRSDLWRDVKRRVMTENSHTNVVGKDTVRRVFGTKCIDQMQCINADTDQHLVDQGQLTLVRRSDVS